MTDHSRLVWLQPYFSALATDHDLVDIKGRSLPSAIFHSHFSPRRRRRRQHTPHTTLTNHHHQLTSSTMSGRGKGRKGTRKGRRKSVTARFSVTTSKVRLRLPFCIRSDSDLLCSGITKTCYPPSRSSWWCGSVFLVSSTRRLVVY